MSSMPNVDYGGLPCVEPIGLRPIKFDVGTSSKENLLIYIKDGECQPLTNTFNAYTYAIKVPGNVRMTYLNTIYTLSSVPLPPSTSPTPSPLVSSTVLPCLWSHCPPWSCCLRCSSSSISSGFFCESARNGASGSMLTRPCHMTHGLVYQGNRISHTFGALV